jgi:hypothetical protein
LKPSDFELEKEEWFRLADQYIYGKNGERDKKILLGAIVYGKTYERLAEENGLTTESVKKIVHKRRNVLFKHI